MMPISKAEIKRAIRKAEESIDLLDLDLSRLKVLTEVGSNYFALTPVIALMAGALEVFAWTKDSRFGKGSENVEECKDILKEISYKGEIKFRVNRRPIEDIKSANIITNSGFIRPLDKFFLKHVSPSSTVIPLMYESWEFRDEDIDINYCKNNNIKVAGTWENHPAIKVFSATGPLAIKLAMEANCEVYQNNIIVWSDDHFGKEAKKSFERLGASTVLLTTDKEVLMNNLRKTDFIYICNYNEKRKYFGEDDKSIFDIKEIYKQNSGIQIIHLYGDIDNDLLDKYSIGIYPPKKGYSSVMTYTLAHLGMTPLIRLQTGGLKVGEVIYKKQVNKITQII